MSKIRSGEWGSLEEQETKSEAWVGDSVRDVTGRVEWAVVKVKIKKRSRARK